MRNPAQCFLLFLAAASETTAWTSNITAVQHSLGNGVYGTPMYGGINDYAYYFVDVLVGTPSRRQSVILDSGSSLLGFPCSNCGRKCGRHIDEPFDVGKSVTSEIYSCHNPKCISSADGCSQGADQCRYSQVYSEGSSIEGYFFSDELSLAPMGSAPANPRVRYDYIGCHQKETVLFTSQQASGILGVSFPRGGKQPTVMDALTTRRRQFAICASEDGGVLLVNGWNRNLNRPSRSKAFPETTVSSGISMFGPGKWLRGWNRMPIIVNDMTSDIVWTKLANQHGYSIKVASISGYNPATAAGAHGYEKIIDRGFGEVLVDSGTTYTYLPNEVYQRVSKWLIDKCTANNLLSDNLRAGQCLRSKQDLICYDFTNTKLPLDILFQRIPSLSLELPDGQVIAWGPEAYLFRKTERYGHDSSAD